MCARAHVQVDNPTPIVLSREKSVIHGIRGSAVLSPCTRCSSSTGQAVCRCGLDDERHRRSVEIPTWMFEPAVCSRLRVVAVPSVCCDALLELTALLRVAPRAAVGGVLQAQHRSLLAVGGADAPVSEPTATLATHAVSCPTLGSVVSDVATRDPSEDDHVAGAAASSARRPRRRLRPGAGGA